MKLVSRRALPIAALVVLLVLVVVGVVARSRQGNAIADLGGVRLGMSVPNVRARFDALGGGQWTSKVGDDVILTWAPTANTRGGPLAATFEFHLGILMAIRADLTPGDRAASGPAWELSDSAVIVREKDGAGVVHLTAIARSCPIHKDEAQRLVEKHR